MYSITQSFDNEADFLEHINKIKKTIKKEPKEDDKRGGHMMELHRQAKKLQNEQPNLKYKECMALIAK